MQKIYPLYLKLLFCLALSWNGGLLAQMGFKINLPKSEEYEERVLRSEKTKEGKLGFAGKVLQNTVTYFNYTYNAERKLNEVLLKAKGAHRDDYFTLLPFYNYSLSVTRKDSIELDSVIQKANSGIALHDLRNNWTDDLYLLWGISYYLQEKFDSAHLLFQFINYYYAPRQKDGYFKTIGSARDGNQSNSIANPEKKRIIGNAASRRNDALIWQIRNYLAQDQLTQAAGLLQTLRSDPQFPARLRPDLFEVTAHAYYKQQQWDSAAFYLSKALPGVPSQNEKARMEYLTGQLFEKAGNFAAASIYYSKAIPHAADIILDIQSRIAAIRVTRSNGNREGQNNVAMLLDMANKEKYNAYKDLIYYAAAQMDLAAGNKERAIQSLWESTTGLSNSSLQRNKAFLQLAELSYGKGAYGSAYQYYDSLKAADSLGVDPALLQLKKSALGKLVAKMEVIKRQDSLLRIAAMPDEERKEFVRKLVRQLRKQAGLVDEPQTSAVVKTTPSPVVNALFGNETEKGEWYFYNAASRSRGQAAFTAKWGNRPNVDNWRRAAVLQTKLATLQAGLKDSATTKTTPEAQGVDFDALYAKLPLSSEAKKIAEDSLSSALLEAGRVLIQEIEDCAAGTTLLKRLSENFPRFEKLDEAIFYQYGCYSKLGSKAEVSLLLTQLKKEYPNSPYTQLIDTTTKRELRLSNQQGDSIYAIIYDQFAAGNYQKALLIKKEADKVFGDSLWTPQLLYMEAAYYVQAQQDSTAIRILRELQIRFSTSPLFEKATYLLEAIAKRKQLEQQTTLPVDSIGSTKPSIAPVKPITPSAPPIDTAQLKTGYQQLPTSTHMVLFTMLNTDPVLAAEAMRAIQRYNREVFFNKTFTTQLLTLSTTTRLIVVGPFENLQEATTYIAQLRPQTAVNLVPWMNATNYDWLPIATSNLPLLLEQKDLPAYRSFLNTKRP